MTANPSSVTRRRTARKLHPSEYRILAEFRFALRQFLSFSESAAGELGLAPQQYQALLAIIGLGANQKGVTINALARTLLIKHNSAVGLVDRLQDEGLVTRRTATDDRRKVNLQLTPRGLRIFEKLAAAHREELTRLGPQLAEYLDYFSRTPGRLASPSIRRAAKASPGAHSRRARGSGRG
ncbi:MAG: MarR family transcriptional regulator [Proteobacteria bacterium]|nr:MarR family transcriptional regulator [Pseudomonadota bacterium]